MPGETQVGLGHDGQVVKAGTVLPYRFAIVTLADAPAGEAASADAAASFNMNGGRDGYPIAMKVGEVTDTVFFFTARAQQNEAVFTLGPRNMIIDLPIRVQGLEDNGCAAVFSTKRPWFRFVSVVKDTAYFQEPIDKENEMWIGNVFVCDNKDVKITLVVDGQADGKLPFVELHNPTDKDVTATLRSPIHAPMFGGLAATVKIPAGDSVRLKINFFGVLISCAAIVPTRAEAPRVLPAGQLPQDKRLGPLKDLNGYFPFTPCSTPRSLATARGATAAAGAGGRRIMAHARRERPAIR